MGEFFDLKEEQAEKAKSAMLIRLKIDLGRELLM